MKTGSCVSALSFENCHAKASRSLYESSLNGYFCCILLHNSSISSVKSAAERVAINSPIQGTAADIIKMAMINISREMEEKSLCSKMLLQVHDELIFEVMENEIEIMKKLVRTCMESVVKLKVPLKVNMELGVNWFDLK